MRLPEFLEEQDGEARLVGHRISLHHLLSFYREGYNAEMLHEQFPTLPMALIHKVLAFYWEHPKELDTRLSRERDRLDALRKSGEGLDTSILRSRCHEVSGEDFGLKYDDPISA